ncbi:MAG: sugar phosphate nucleotidyltransferase, partial [Dehalococcoidia bacterium]
MSNRTQIVVLAGGLATRLHPLTEQAPKSLVPVLGRTFLDYQLDLFRRQGITDVVLLVGHLGEQIEQHLRKHRPRGLEIHCSHEGDELLGTAGAVRQAEAYLADEFFLIYGDSYLLLDYAEVQRFFRARKKLGLMVVYRNRDHIERSNIVVEGELVAAYDKQQRLPAMDWINFGVSLLRKETLQIIPADRPYSQEEWYRMLIAQRELLA